MKREDVYNATAWQVNREILPVNMSVGRQLEEMQIEQTIPFSIKKRIIFEVIPSGSVCHAPIVRVVFQISARSE